MYEQNTDVISTQLLFICKVIRGKNEQEHNFLSILSFLLNECSNVQ